VRLPAQVAYVSSTTSRGHGCTDVGGTLSCDLDTLAAGAVATVRITVVVREAGTLVLEAVSSSQPADPRSANDTATVTTIVAPRETFAPPNALPVLRPLAPAPHVARSAGVATLTVRFSITEAARLRATVTSLRSRRVLTLLARTSLAGTSTSTKRTAASAAVKRGGAYLFRARVLAGALTRGRMYVVRITATDTAGAVKTLSMRVKV
jgi:hypothetical protein